MSEHEHLDIPAFKARLEAERRSLVERIRAAMHASDDPDVLALAQRTAETVDGGDAALGEALRGADLALLRQEQEELRMIDLALERIALGTYGLCSHCGNPIGQARLDALPMANWCLSCKSEFEQRRGIVGSPA
ncbi:TraR/DksA C4-type zinc finger protein [Massilia sp. TS11]|uniref:TraR/DksA family transcriptional regulator n=1 Tax=Massilia sp. TS11 TaxID=2908003 RepID=UPI001EDAF53C|nr:TraR/DksA C4-type zinc finger protein [Massilia sp. TS11]MCG2583986.1 TraR/DksA C4-type zinc finger protein [Massilia sp. TS11]